MGEALRKPIENPDEHTQKYTAQTPPDQMGIGAFPEIQKIIDEDNASIKKRGLLGHLQKERIGGFSHEDQLEKLQAQLQKEIALDKQTRAAKPESEIIELSDEDVVDEAKEWHKRGYVALDEEALPLAIPDEVALPNAQRYLELEKRMEELEAERKQMKTQKVRDIDQKQLLSIMHQETKAKSEMNKLEAYFRKNGVKIVQLEGIVRRARKQIVDTETEKPAESKETPEPKTHSAREVYDRGSYRGPIGGIGLGNIAGAMERGSGVLRHYAGPRAGETESAPERTNEEALFDLDQDLTKEKSAKNLLLKLFHGEESKSKIHLDNEEHVATIMADKTFLQALDIEKWNGDLSVLKEMVGRLSLEKSDELTAIKHNKGWFRRLFESSEEKLLKTQMEALDDFAGKLIVGGKEGPTPPQTNRLLRAMTKR